MHTFSLIFTRGKMLKSHNPHRGAFTFSRHQHYRIVHLHSIIVEITHRHVLNTECKERNVWQHFNLREEKEEAGGKPGDVVM